MWYVWHLFPEHLGALLRTASRQSLRDIVTYLLQETEVDIDAADKNGFTPLMYAAVGGDPLMFQIIQEQGGTEGRNNLQITAMMVLAANGNTEIVNQLFDRRDVDINATDNEGSTALFYAVESGNTEMFTTLYEQDATHRTVQNNDGLNALMLASHKGHNKMVKYLLNKSDLNVCTKDNRGSTALLLAAQEGHIDTFTTLCEHGGLDKNEGLYILMIAAHKGHTNVVSHLLDRGHVDVNARCHRCQTALLFPTQQALSTPCKPQSVMRHTNNRVTAMMVAASNGHTELVRYLLHRGDVNANAKYNGQTSLLLAAQKGHTETFITLYQDKSVNKHIVDKRGENVLMAASKN